ncbi:hypothetical protein ACH4E8_24155 [Streptomyces sp. NPDC017979]|uniref:hypothetical protein n=1 Tax=Streptomyces sp. NPDC017979 TaxID=3365024 RepID=UPI0037B22626
MCGELDELRVGELAYDTESQTIGVVMEVFRNYYALRPPRGGIEWDALRDLTRRATNHDRLAPALSERNANSSQRA